MRRSISRSLALLFIAVLALAVSSPAAVAASPATSVSATWSSSQVEYKDPVTVSGMVSPAASREVVLERMRDNQSVARVAAVLSAADGRYRLQVPSGEVGEFTYRVSVRAESGTSSLLAPEPVASDPHGVRVLRDTSAGRVAWPAARVLVNTAITARGVVSGGDGGVRTVKLQQRLKTGWRNVRSARTTSDGTYSLRVPTNWYYRTPLRVYSPASTTATRMVSESSVMAVRPAYTPAGSSSAWSPLSREYEFRFNPCQAVTYRLNVARAPKGAAKDAHEAVRRMAQATGLRFRYLGTTSSIPGSARTWSSDTNLVVAWARPTETKWDLRGATVGRGGVLSSEGVRRPNGSWTYKTTRAGVVIDSTANLRGGFAKGSVRGQVLMHELGHAAGISHTNGAYQIMRSSTSSKRAARWGAGDLAGLSRMGMNEGCL
jgi:hypothetical protein